MKHFKNFIFDVDGTIWNTTDVVAKAWNRAIETDGHSRTRVDGAKLQTLFGKPMTVIASRLFTDVTPEVCEKLLKDCCMEEQKELEKSKEHLRYPHVKETIRRLKEEKDCRLFIVSNCQTGYIELVMEKNHLEPYIEDFECFGNTGQQKAENISSICERNGLKKQETVYVGDTKGDFEATKEAGLPFVYASYGFGKVSGSDYQINDFAELLELA